MNISRLLLQRVRATALSTVCALVATLCANVSHAEPSVTVSAEPLDGSRYVVFTFVQNDLPSMEGCFYNFMAATSARKLEQRRISATSIATFFRPEPVIQIIAGPLDTLSQNAFGLSSQGKSARIYFRTLITCYNGAITRAETFSMRFRATPRGELSSLKKLIRQMKFHMAYYEGE